MSQVILNEDVYSNFNIRDKDRIPYGKKNEVVTVVWESLPVLIVRSKNGGLFSVNVNKIINLQGTLFMDENKNVIHGEKKKGPKKERELAE